MPRGLRSVPVFCFSGKQLTAERGWLGCGSAVVPNCCRSEYHHDHTQDSSTSPIMSHPGIIRRSSFTDECCRTNKPARHTSNHLANARAHLLNINMIADQGFINMMVHQSSSINMASFEKRGQQVEFQQPQALEGKGQERYLGKQAKTSKGS